MGGSIPPVGPGSFPSYPPSSDPAVKEFYQMWTEWFNDPHEDSSLKTGKELLSLLEASHDHFSEIASKRPLPHPHVEFEDAYSATIKTLKDWISQEEAGKTMEKNGTSEFLNDIYQWINYVNV